LLARDRLGIKPLYYANVGGRLVFGSEMKVVLDNPDIERRLNWGAVGHYFATMTTPGNESIIEGVHKLLPGHVLTASLDQGIEIRQYWDVAFEPERGKSENYFIERLRDLLEESVRLRLIADVPLGAFLSGGIDSSSVVATMARLTSRPVKTFSIGFNEPEYNELDHARKVAEHFGTEHQELVIDPNVLGIIDDLAWYLDEPFADSSAIPTYMVSKLAAESVKVVLSGDGGDELFAGYDKYLVEQRERRYSMIPGLVRKTVGLIGQMMPEGAKGRNFLRHLAVDGAARYFDANTLFDTFEKAALLQSDVFAAVSGNRVERMFPENPDHWLSRLQYMDLKAYLPNDILTKVDRMSMANSIEARVPLLDHKFVEFAATIPPELKLHGTSTKYIFKRALEGIVPNDVLTRPKRGFAVPLSHWFRGKLDGFVRDLLLDSTSRQRGIFNPSYIEKLLRLNASGRNMDLQIWSVIVFELWCRRFLDRSVREQSYFASVG
jgi:asparagine synthase (glutamine-hydrolysing)